MARLSVSTKRRDLRSRLINSRAAEYVARQLANGSCATRVRGMFGLEPPLMDYWDGRAA